MALWTSFVRFNYLEVEIVIHGEGRGDNPLHTPSFPEAYYCTSH